MIFHCNNGYPNAPQRYVIRTFRLANTSDRRSMPGMRDANKIDILKLLCLLIGNSSLPPPPLLGHNTARSFELARDHLVKKR